MLTKLHRTSFTGPLSVLILSGLPLAGCAVDGGQYPSLDRRAVERAGSLEPTAPPPPPPLTSGLPAQLNDLLSDARSAHERFLSLLPSARRRINAAAGAPVGSDRWGDAQIALASLESARSETAFPLADLDLLIAERAAEGLGPDIDRITAIRATVVEMFAQEDEALDQIGALQP